MGWCVGGGVLQLFECGFFRFQHLSKKLFNSQTQSKPSEELLKDNNSFVECEKLEDSSALCKLGRKMVNDREVAVAVCSVLEEPSSKDTDSGRQVEG